MTQYEFTCLTAINHVKMIEGANELGALGWSMVTTDRPHEFWIAVFQREKIAGAEAFPAEHDRTGVGVFGIAGGDADGRIDAALPDATIRAFAAQPVAVTEPELVDEVAPHWSADIPGFVPLPAGIVA